VRSLGIFKALGAGGQVKVSGEFIE
jgi:hypothetical protein